MFHVKHLIGIFLRVLLCKPRNAQCQNCREFIFNIANWLWRRGGYRYKERESDLPLLNFNRYAVA